MFTGYEDTRRKARGISPFLQAPDNAVDKCPVIAYG